VGFKSSMLRRSGSYGRGGGGKLPSCCAYFRTLYSSCNVVLVSDREFSIGDFAF
jgi:hypothetical protein